MFTSIYIRDGICIHYRESPLAEEKMKRFGLNHYRV